VNTIARVGRQSKTPPGGQATLGKMFAGTPLKKVVVDQPYV
jgi:hypothetical protein